MKKDNLLNDIARLLMVEKEALNETICLHEELNWDTFSLVSTVASIQFHYAIDCDGGDLMHCESIEDIFALIEKQIPRALSHGHHEKNA